MTELSPLRNQLLGRYLVPLSVRKVSQLIPGGHQEGKHEVVHQVQDFECVTRALGNTHSRLRHLVLWLVATPDVSHTQEKYKRKPQLGEAPSIRSKCAWLSCGVLIISSLVCDIY